MKNPVGINFCQLNTNADDLTTIQDLFIFSLFEDFKNYFQQPHLCYRDFIFYLSYTSESIHTIADLLDLKNIKYKKWNLCNSGQNIGPHGHGLIVNIDKEDQLLLKLSS